MARIDTKQVCRNGHYITDGYHSSPESREEYCKSCGAETIIACEKCGDEIEGENLDSTVVFVGRTSVPDHCSKCGTPYPWTNPSEPDELDIDLPDQFFDEDLARRSFKHFDSGDYQEAIQQAFILLEERIRSKADLPQDMVGSKLCQTAFAPTEGPLSTGETGGEQEGVRSLFKGSFLAFRNASHHRFLDEEHLDTERAYSLLCLINMLLTMTDEAAEDS